MSHKPIFIKNLSFVVQHKTCFEDFNATVYSGNKIGIVGDNGSGKSTLLKIIQSFAEASVGQVVASRETTFGFVPQLSIKEGAFSGGQRFNTVLSQALAIQPDVLCLDEPTNHLDTKNRRSLMRMLQHFEGTLLVVSHDVELLRNCVDIIWAIQDEKVLVFDGSYDAFVQTCNVQQAHLQQRIKSLESQQIDARKELRFQLERSARRARANKNENDKKLVGFLKESANSSLGKHQDAVGKVAQKLENERAQLRQPEKIKVSFDILASNLYRSSSNVIEVSEGAVGYLGSVSVVDKINFVVASGERIALIGDNGSGKSTLLKALFGSPEIVFVGSWRLPEPQRIGYLDQHYKTLPKQLSVLEVAQRVSNLPQADLRKILNDFLFRKNGEVCTLVSQLSGGEMARLALACIALQQPNILLLDEVTNNLDLQTREHVIQVLNSYPGIVVVISHDEDFLQRINIMTRYEFLEGTIKRIA